MLTHKEAAVPVDPQGCSAVVAVGHDGIIGEADATDRLELGDSKLNYGRRLVIDRLQDELERFGVREQWLGQSFTGLTRYATARRCHRP